MPTLTISISYRITQDEALRRIKAYIDRLKAQYAGKVSDLEESWNGYVGSFSGSGMGQTISGTLAVNDSDVVVELDLPFAAMLIKGKIESSIRNELSRVLA